MRDGNGSGNVYFEDLFANGIPFASLIFWSLNGAIGFINTILAPIFFYTSCFKQSHHKNLRLITSNLYLIFFVTGLGNFIYTILVITHTSDREYATIFVVCYFIQITGADVWKTTFLAIIMERATATIFYKVYEKQAPILLGIILCLFGLTGTLLPLCYIIFRMDLVAAVIICLFISFICWIFIYLLSRVNRRMRKLKSSDKIDLSHRYQITENLRFLQMITPIIIIGCIIDTTSTIIAGGAAIIDYKLGLYYPIYAVMTNLYVPIFCLIYFKKDAHTRMMILKLLKIKTMKVEPQSSQIRNVVGDLLVVKNSPEIHFKQLVRFWT